MTQSDFFFTPRAVVVHTGDSLRITNISSTSPHTFTISGKGIDVVNDPGEAKSITITLKPGNYPFVCTFHQALGMTGTLIVSAPGTKPAPGAVAAAAAAAPGAGSSPGADGPSGVAPGSSPSSAVVGPVPQAAGGAGESGAAGRAGRGFPLGPLVIVGGLLVLAAGTGSLVLNFRNRLRARSGG